MGPTNFSRILIAVTEDPIALHAADIGVNLARALNPEVAFVCVIDPSAIGVPGDGVPVADLVAQAEADARAAIATLRERLPAGRRSFEFVVDGSPAKEIVKAAAEWPAELIVLGSHGRRGVARAILGSVAEHVMRHAPCPVLVTRAER